MKSQNPIFQTALDADNALDAAIEKHFPGKTRWTLTREQEKHPAIAEALHAKRKADATWLAVLRTPKLA